MKTITNHLRKLIHTILSISGFVPEHMTPTRYVFMLGSFFATFLLLPIFTDVNIAIYYFICSTALYIGFIFIVLPKNGLRKKMIYKYGEHKGYLLYEGLLAFTFYHNGVGLVYISQKSVGSGFFTNVPVVITIGLAAIFFIIGMGTKIWSTFVIGIPIYYWKDMFLGKKVCNFVETGPYKYLSNPIYGVGQLHVYGIAIYYNSIYGLIFAAINQCLIFLFYFTVEKPFIYRKYFNQKVVPLINTRIGDEPTYTDIPAINLGMMQMEFSNDEEFKKMN